MSSLIVFLIIIAIWLLLQLYVLPKMGVAT